MKLPYDQSVARNRKAAEDSLTQEARITRPGTFVDEGGGAGYYTDDVVVTFPCRITTLGGTPQEVEVASQLQDITVGKLVYPLDVTVLGTDELEVGDKTYAIVGTPITPTIATRKWSVIREIRRG